STQFFVTSAGFSERVVFISDIPAWGATGPRRGWRFHKQKNSLMRMLLPRKRIRCGLIAGSRLSVKSSFGIRMADSARFPAILSYEVL
ncbi:hypothetical protein, partial [Gluconobacter sp.]|uniref:hypothetical protein n=1 Tax=Gluconobacter sp. TaxID=1876758 RepID=UPI0039ED35CB